MGALIQDLRYGLRTLAKNPGFTAVAVLTLALGIGANTAIFSVVDAVLLRPLPYPEPDRLFTVYQTLPRDPAQNTGVSYPNYLDWTQQNRVFESIAAVRGNSLALSGQGEPTYIETGSVTANYFEVLRARPLLGRTLQPSDDALDANPAVVMSETLWRARFGLIRDRGKDHNARPASDHSCGDRACIFPSTRTRFCGAAVVSASPRRRLL